MKDTKRSLLTSVVALLLCFSMLLGTTYAWFTDSATSAGNVIQSGNLDIEMYWSDRFLAADSDEWKLADEKPIFTHDNWEPGYTDVKYVKIKNAGNLSFKWKLSLEAEGQFTDLADVIDVYYVDPAVELTSLADRDSVGTLAEVATKKTSIEGVLLPENETSNEYATLEAVVAIALHMDEEAGNKYQGTDLGCGFSVSLIATQFGYEEDSFNKEYDKDSDWPVNVIVGALNASANVDLTADNKVATGVNMSARDSEGNEISAEVPAGVGATKDKLTLTITTKEKSDANIVLNETEAILPLDVHIDGVAEDNEVVIKIKSEKLLPEGLNLGNHQLYHVEDGKTVAMTLLESGAQPEHNNYEYDPTTGDVVFYLKSFSEVALVADTENAWEGKFDYSWYDASKTNLTIANADQLAAFGAIVGGMKKITSVNENGTYVYSDEVIQDSFSGKTVKLVADINLGDKESENNPDIIFYPIGYWNNEGTYERLPANQRENAVSSGFYAFEGTFDGNGNTIKNFYQNTWEMKGDHDWYDVVKEQYFRDGFGLFGKVYGGTVKNLIVDNYSCDSEIGTTGVIAAYADSKNGQSALFENITITNCNPRVYNIGNGGIVGCAGWYSRNEDLSDANYANAVTFKNITVDQTNKISALWGSWGVSCAGILGQYYPNSACGIKLENCHVAAVIDVNNDVCSNYQYYWYRYAGMFIGTIRANTTDSNGYTVADTTGVKAKDCTYTMGTWNEYWYCEIVANSIASYTHDHQFSRLDNITDISEIKNADGTWKKEGHFALLSSDRKSVECYHIFKDSNGNLYQHLHDKGDETNGYEPYETVDVDGDGIKEEVLKEDRQRYFIPFNQLLTGLDMGIKAHTKFEGITFVENGTVKSENKFESLGTVTTYKPGQTINLGELVEAIVDESKIAKATLYAAVSPAVDNNNTNVSATFSLDAGNWENSSITFGKDCTGAVKIVITDYFYCTPTVIYLDPETAAEKFTVNTVGEKKAYTKITLGDLFTAKDGETIGNVTATVTYLNGVETSITATSSEWAQKTIDLTKDGTWTVVIKDDDEYCSVTTVTLTVNKADKFTKKFDKDFLYRVGNANEASIGKIFGENTIDYSEYLSSVNVTIENVAGNATGTYTSNATWTDGTIQFTGTGIVKVTISAEGANPIELYLEVVDATNVTGLSGTLTGNVVLLNNCGLSSLTVSGRNTVYGNGFTATYTGDGRYLNNGLKQGVITVQDNGTIDNLRVVASIYPYMAFSYSDVQDTAPKEVDGTKTRYYYQLSAISASGNATITNCYVYGGRTNVFIGGGNVTIKDTILECGVAANAQIISSNEYTVTLENVTTIQKHVSPTVGEDNEKQSYKMLGLGILLGELDKDQTYTSPKIIINGEFKQYNWASKTDANNINHKYAGYSQTLITEALNQADFKRNINGIDSVNMGIVFLNSIEPNIVNNTGLNYAGPKTISIATLSGQVYSLSSEAPDSQVYNDVANADRTTENDLYKPQFKYPADLGGQLVEDNGGDEFLYREGDTIKVMFPSGDTKEIDLRALVNIVKYGEQDLNMVISLRDEAGNVSALNENKASISAAGLYTITYKVTDKLFYDKDGKQINNAIDYTWKVTIDVALKDTAVPNAYFEFDSSKQVIYRSGNSSIVQFIPFLAGLKIYDYNGQTAYLRFDGDNDFNKIAKASINNINTTGEAQGYHIVTVEFTDGGKLVIDMDVRANSGSSTHSGSIKVRNNVIYVVNGGTTSGKGQTWKIYSYKFVGNNGTEINSGLVTFGTAGVDCNTATKPSSNFGTSVKYTVTYDANGGNCGQTLGYATSVATAVTLPTPTRSGYIFAGWYTAASDGTRVGGAGESYTPSANITLYAQWGKPCTVTYNANGGSCDKYSEKYSGTALTLPTPTRDGYWFIGWYDAATGGNKIGDAGAIYNPSGEITIYAHWQEAIKYTVTYNANGGTCGTASATYQGTALTLPTPTRTGYTFNGWYTAVSGGTKIGAAGASYIPSANVTLYAQWKINSYTITVTTENATVKVNGTTVNNNGTVSIQYGDNVTVEVTYSKPDNRSTTISGADGKTYTSPFSMPAQNVTINARSNECITPDTLITLADGTQVRVDSLTGDELLLVWNMETGKLDYAPIMFVDSEAETEFEVIKLYFSDGTEVKVIGEHGFWDYDLNKYVYLDRYAEQYIGHTFAKQNGDSLEKVQLVDVVIETEITTAWSPVTEGHLCYFVNGMLSMPGGVGGLFNIFEVDAETMTYDYEQMQKDVETYGLYTYEELNAICPLSEEMFNAAGGAYLKISIAKGNLTVDELIYMITRYSKFI